MPSFENLITALTHPEALPAPLAQDEALWTRLSQAYFCNPLYCQPEDVNRPRNLAAFQTEYAAHFEGLSEEARRLFHAVVSGDIAALQKAVADGVDLATVVDKKNRSLLHLAAAMNDTAMIRYLFERGLSNDLEDEHTYSPMHYAAAHGSLEAVQTLHELGVCAAQCLPFNHRTPIYFAIEGGHEAMVRLLCEQDGADQVDVWGNHPLVFAMTHKQERGMRERLVSILINHTSRFDYVDEIKRNAYVIARKSFPTLVDPLFQRMQLVDATQAERIKFIADIIQDIEEKATEAVKRAPRIQTPPTMTTKEDLLAMPFIVGEGHRHTSSKQFLIDNMAYLKEQGYTTFFMEFLHYDDQELIDQYLASDSDVMPEKLQQLLKKFDDGHGGMSGDTDPLWQAYNYTALVKAAKAAGVRVVALESTEIDEVTKADRWGQHDDRRTYYFNYIAQAIIEREASHGKWFALMGSAHVGLCKEYAGVAQLTGARQVYVFDEREQHHDQVRLNHVETLRHGDRELVCHADLYMALSCLEPRSLRFDGLAVTAEAVAAPASSPVRPGS